MEKREKDNRPYLLWQKIRRLDGRIERVCCHGIGHTSPETPDSVKNQEGNKDSWAIHGCDGCCAPMWPKKEEKKDAQGH
jgi:hypothetical protein